MKDIKKYFVCFSLRNRRKRKRRRDENKMKEIKRMSDKEFQSEYIELKSRYEHKK